MRALRILVVGSGAREHAICWRLATEPGVERVIVAPGNVLMEDVADVKHEVGLSDHRAIVALALAARTDFVVVGPEGPLVEGLGDRLADAGIACFGPDAAAARLEGSKAFAREICAAAGVHMAEGRAFDAVAPALEYADVLGTPLVVKADGLAAGKGVVICETSAEVEHALREALEHGRFGRSGQRVVIERALSGSEASVIALCDGTDALLLPAARDHKRLGDGDSGPNTGGMGAYSPVDGLDEAALAKLGEKLIRPVLAEMAARVTPFRGALYAGLMLTDDGPRLLEFNVRFGDPEAQAILPRLAVRLAPLLLGAAQGRLAAAAAEAGIEGGLVPATAQASVAVTLAAEGYPETPRAGDPIEGIDAARAAGALVFGAGLRRENHDGLVTAGGRVASVVGRGSDLRSAADAAYAAAELITYAGRAMRRDIGRLHEAVAA
jgi:phosphoribosylamine--glycine ligase